MSYAELFCQSNFSFLQGASHPEELVLQAQFLGYRALAITDECSVAGVVRAHTAIKQHQLKLQLIIGSMFRLHQPGEPPLQVVLLCPDKAAYAELCRIITNARRRSEKGRYELAEWDLMSLRHCLVIWLPTGDDGDHHWAAWLAKYHQPRLWLGLQRHLREQDHQYQQHCQGLSQQYRLPLTCCGGVLMHNPTRLPLQHVLSAVRHGTTVQQAGRQLLGNAETALRSVSKIQRLFQPAWIDESLAIARRCRFGLDELGYQYPDEVVPAGKTPMAYLRQLVSEGIPRRFPDGIAPAIQATIDKELQLIDEQGYAHFFLTIYDIVQFAKREGILYQGRGSAANSVVCYCLEITSVDPRQIAVLFERFISKERNEPPDIDVDFEHERREEVIQYIYQKYGRKRTAIAATVISYRFKSAVRDVGKALGLNETQLDFFIKNVNRRDRQQGWQAQVVELGLDPASATGQHFIELVNELIGFPRHLSQHVGGFVISAGPLHELVPVENAAMAERTVIQWDKDDLTSLGLLKVDVLALGMLTAIRKSFALVEQTCKQSLTIADITRKKDDKKVFSMIQRADTVGVFQIESRAQMSMLPRLRPACFYDLVIQIAIVRPGPIMGDMVHPYLKRRHGEEPVEYPSEAVKETLSRTLGVPIFQEQVIKLAMVAAGFTGGEADQLRRAMAKWKKNGELAQFKSKLIEGMQARGYQTAYAERIFEQICGFGEYGFPESHSASFAVLAYTSAWLKCHYPAAFYTALLNCRQMGFYSPSQLIQDAKRHDILVLPVCVNASAVDNSLVTLADGQGIRLGLRMIKSLGRQAAEQLVAQRPKGGYANVTQLKQLALRRNDLEALASADALVNLAGDRYAARWQMMDTVEDLPLFAHAGHPPAIAEPANITGSPDPLSAPGAVDNLLEDYAALGLSLNHHPIQLLREAGLLCRHTPAAQLSRLKHKSLVTVIGVVTGKQAPGTAGGVTFVTLEDDTGNINTVIWSATARAQKQPYLTARILKVDGILEREGEVIHVIAGKLEDLSHHLDSFRARSRDFH